MTQFPWHEKSEPPEPMFTSSEASFDYSMLQSAVDRGNCAQELISSRAGQWLIKDLILARQKELLQERNVAKPDPELSDPAAVFGLVMQDLNSRYAELERMRLEIDKAIDEKRDAEQRLPQERREIA